MYPVASFRAKALVVGLPQVLLPTDKMEYPSWEKPCGPAKCLLLQVL